MTQFNFGTIVATTKSGSGLAADLNAWRDAMHTSHKGPSRPSYAVPGLNWLNDVDTPWEDYVYDGTDDTLRGFIDPTTHRYSSTGAAAKTIASGGATAHLGDWGTLFNFSGSSAQTCAIDTKDTLLPGWWIRVIAQSVTVTIDPFGAETIQGLPQILLPAGSATTVFYDGANFWTDANGGGASAFPVGGVVYVPAGAPPQGFLRMNGALLSRQTYGGLWGFAQTSSNMVATDSAWTEGKFSPGDGSTTFRIPDGRGNFLRALDDGRGVDSGRTIGTSQADQMISHSHGASMQGDDRDHAHAINGGTDGQGSHNHTFPIYAGDGGRGEGAGGNGLPNLIGNYGTSTVGAHGHNMSFWSGGINTGHLHALTINAAGAGNETRVRNVALLACIKF